ARGNQLFPASRSSFRVGPQEGGARGSQGAELEAVRVPRTRGTPRSWAGPAGLWEGGRLPIGPAPFSGVTSALGAPRGSGCAAGLGCPRRRCVRVLYRGELDSARSLRSSLGCPAGLPENEGVLHPAEGAAPPPRKTGFFWALRLGASAGAAAPAAHVLRYYLLGTNISYCEVSSGTGVNWSDNPPTCEKILCQPPPEIQNGKYTNNHKDVFEYNEVVTYSCDPSNGPDEYSLVGESKLTCIGNGEWSSQPPQCKVVKCVYPAIEHGTIVSGFGPKYYYKATVVLKCNEGFNLYGNSVVVCGENSTWEPELPKCIKGHPPRPTDASPPNGAEGLGAGYIVLVIVAVLIGVGLLLCLYCCFCRQRKKGIYVTGESHRQDILFLSEKR
uniref:Membrane cofactor protein n=1 Tax=Bos taurus TaxID=9913 RepID=A0AAA9T5L5_BOVIN